jgi:hypothetical protein
VVEGAEPIGSEAVVERILHAAAAGVQERVLDIGVTRERERASPQSGRHLLEGEGLSVPVLEVSRDEDGLAPAPHEGGRVSIDDRRALLTGSRLQRRSVHVWLRVSCNRDPHRFKGWLWDPMGKKSRLNLFR